ncbi:MAG: hypothetical protein JWP30_1572 [Homoserinimonas sp.]|nr:hypothetical protein [Homoserinimonas sp.]
MTSQAQQQYQVRFEWGIVGARCISDGADAIVWVDQLAHTAALPEPTEFSGVLQVAGTIQNRAAIAQWVLDRQSDRGDRFTIAVVAVGEARTDGSLRFAVEDLLGAGAVIDALAEVGIDHSSPEAAAACAAYTGLSRAASHLISASTSGQALGRPLVELEASGDVPVIQSHSAG